MVAALVPARNEESTVGGVVDALTRSGLVETILVVDDGSTDRTAERARDAGATVLSREGGQGKGAAMLAGLGALGRADPVAFFDADLVGLEPHHVRRLVALSELGYDMVAALRDYGLVRNFLQPVGPLITGERICRRWVLDRVGETCWKGYAIETAINDAVTRGGGRTALTLLRGVTIRTKQDKFGWVTGALGQLRMAAEIAQTERALGETCGSACRT